MHFITSKQELLRSLAIVSKATSKLQKTVLECILFECKQTGIVLKATDIALSIETTLPADILEEGEAAIPARYLYEIIAKFPDNEITFKSADDTAIEIICMNSKVRLQSMPSDEFPAFPDHPAGPFVKMPQSLLRGMISETIFAAAVSEDKPILTGLDFVVKKDFLEIVALDGYRLALRSAAVLSDIEFSCVVPARAAKEVMRIAEDSDAMLKFCVTGTMAAFEIGQTMIYTRLLEGEYIRYQNLIPKNQTIEVLCEREMLKDSLERASVLAREGNNNLVVFVISQNRLSLTSETEIGNIKEELPVVQKGEDITIAFNAKFVLDILKAVPDNEIRMSFATALSPCLVTGVDEGFAYLILPVKT